jgi:hypothetical protein
MNTKQENNYTGQIQELFTRVPREVAEIYHKHPIDAIVEELHQQFTLTLEQKGMLYMEIIFVLTFATSPDEFGIAIRNSLSLSSTQANMLANEVHQRIFNPISEAIDMLGLNEQSKSTRENLASFGIGIEEESKEIPRPMPNMSDTLHGIESPESIPMPRNSFFHAKTSTTASHEMAHIPKPKQVPEPPQAIHHAPVGYGSQDPYLEPINPDDLV